MGRRFATLDVFASTPLAGNPLAVFEDARGLDTATMQSLALQFNLSETTFVLPSTRASALPFNGSVAATTFWWPRAFSPAAISPSRVPSS